MLRLFKGVIIVLFTSAFLAACAIAPRTSDWASPKKFTQEQVFNAAVSTASDMGYSATSIDRGTNSLALAKHQAGTNMTMNVQVKIIGDVLHVTSLASYPEGTFPAVYDETIKNFHAALFRNLNIDKSELNNVTVQEGK